MIFLKKIQSTSKRSFKPVVSHHFQTAADKRALLAKLVDDLKKQPPSSPHIARLDPESELFNQHDEFGLQVISSEQFISTGSARLRRNPKGSFSLSNGTILQTGELSKLKPSTEGRLMVQFDQLSPHLSIQAFSANLTLDGHDLDTEPLLDKIWTNRGRIGIRRTIARIPQYRAQIENLKTSIAIKNELAGQLEVEPNKTHLLHLIKNQKNVIDDLRKPRILALTASSASWQPWNPYAVGTDDAEDK